MIIDNRSPRAATDVIEANENSLANRVEVVRMSENLGFARAFNMGSRLLMERGFHHWVVASHDCVLTPDALKALIAKVREPLTLVGPTVNVFGSDTVFSAGGKTNRFTGRIYAQTAPLDQPRKVEWVDGSCFALGSDLFRATGGMNESLFLYFEDVDLGLRTLRVGGNVWVLPVISYQEPRGPNPYLRGHSSGVIARGQPDLALGVGIVLRNVSGSLKALARGRWHEGVSRFRGLVDGLTGQRPAY